MKSLILGAIEYAKAQGASILEAYPVDTRGKTYPDVFAYTGLFSTFLHLGFQEIERRAQTRPILRYNL